MLWLYALLGILVFIAAIVLSEEANMEITWAIVIVIISPLLITCAILVLILGISWEFATAIYRRSVFRRYFKLEDCSLKIFYNNAGMADEKACVLIDTNIPIKARYRELDPKDKARARASCFSIILHPTYLELGKSADQDATFFTRWAIDPSVRTQINNLLGFKRLTYSEINSLEPTQLFEWNVDGEYQNIYMDKLLEFKNAFGIAPVLIKVKPWAPRIENKFSTYQIYIYFDDPALASIFKLKYL